MLKTYQGSCHCGAVKYEAELDLEAGSGRCNCSICGKARAWGIVIKPDKFKLQTAADALADYNPRGGPGHYRFCKVCGIRTHGDGDIPEIGGAFVSINVATLDVPHDVLAAIPVKYSDGKNDNWWNEPQIKSHL
jgi:hypothetical protein